MSMLLREALKAGVRAGCDAADTRTACTWPLCDCAAMGAATTAAITAFLRKLPTVAATTSANDKRDLSVQYGVNGQLYYGGRDLAAALERSLR